jgi:hypothetical protein
MEQKFPTPYSPLRVLMKKALLWVVLPVSLVIVTLYAIDNYRTPAQLEQQRTVIHQRELLDRVLGRNR